MSQSVPGDCCRCCVKLLLGLGLMALILYLTYRPVRPRYFVTSLSFSLPPSNLTAFYRLEIENKNREISILHDHISLSLSLPPGNLSSSPSLIPAFRQGHRKTAEFAGACGGPDSPGEWARAVANGSAVFRVSVASAFRYKALVWKSRRHYVGVRGDVEVDRQGTKTAEKGIRLSSASPRRQMELTGARWKGKGFADIAHAHPMSVIVNQLQSLLSQSRAQAIVSGCSDTLLEATPEMADLLNRACFGRQINTYDNDKRWFQLGPEEAFYLQHSLHCLTIIGVSGSPMDPRELWEYMKSRKEAFPELYVGYAHLRNKNWVVRAGIQYGVDFVAYRHHPALVHSEYAVLVLSEDGADAKNTRLRVWSDLQCSLRVCGGVAKTLLILSIKRNGGGIHSVGPSCLGKWAVEEHAITRWVPEQCREDHVLGDGGTKQ